MLQGDCQQVCFQRPPETAQVGPARPEPWQGLSEPSVRAPAAFLTPAVALAAAGYGLQADLVAAAPGGSGLDLICFFLFAVR